MARFLKLIIVNYLFAETILTSLRGSNDNSTEEKQSVWMYFENLVISKIFWIYLLQIANGITGNMESD